MRLLLDTNTLVFMLFNKGELHVDVRHVLDDYANTLYTSTVCVQELIHLCQAGKIRHPANRVLSDLTDIGITIEQVTTRHLATLASLPLHNDHHDPNDRLIVAQAITDRIPLVSSDRKFARYEVQGLDFIRNIR